MSNQLYHLYPSALTNRQGKLIKELIPPPKPGARRRELDMRLVLNAIFYVLVGGIQWRMLPREYPHWKSVYHSLGQWRKDGTWQRMHDTLRAQV
jgi:putative transposase